MNCGIYSIESPSGKQYVGSSINIKKRWREHIFALKNKCHVNKKLQNAWNKYKGVGFIFKIIILCDSQNNLMYEQIAFDAFKPAYNLLTQAGRSIGWKHTPEAIKKMKDSHIGQPSSWKGCKHSEESKEKNRLAHLGKVSPKRGVPLSEETKRKISEKLKGYGAGRKLSEEHCKKISESHKKSGHKPSGLALKNSADKNRGSTQTEERKQRRLESYLKTVSKRKHNDIV